MYHLKNLFRRLLIVCNLYAHSPRMRNRLQEKSGSYVSRDTQLSRFQNDVSPSSPLLILSLRTICNQRQESAVLVPDFEVVAHQKIANPRPSQPHLLLPFLSHHTSQPPLPL